MCGNCFLPSWGGSGSTRYATGPKHNLSFISKRADFFRGAACLILSGGENLMPLNRFSPGKGEKLDLPTGNFIWRDWLRLGERGEDAGRGGNLYCSAESAPPLPRRRRCRQPLSALFCPSPLSLTLKVKSHGATGANRLLSRLEVNSEGSTAHSEPFDPTPPMCWDH